MTFGRNEKTRASTANGPGARQKWLRGGETRRQSNRWLGCGVVQEWSIAHTYLVSACNGHSEYKIFSNRPGSNRPRGQAPIPVLGRSTSPAPRTSRGNPFLGTIGSRMRDIVLPASRN